MLDPEVEPILDGGNEYERDRRARRYAIDYVREHPMSTLKLWPRKLWYLYGSDVDGARWCFKGSRRQGR
jgi:hypothetical protein